MDFPDQALKNWFKKNARDLPWRTTKDPYAIWVSEVMLQQTQVKTVLGYYQKWMERFPDLKSLALAKQEEVIKYWEGLGYYSRARRLQQGAKDILEKFEGLFPSTKEDLLRIKGIGPYTVGALMSFAFQQRSTLIDGNVKRVLSRFFALQIDFSISKNHQELEKITEQILPEKEPWVFNEALMELGALICLPKNPKCSFCPLLNQCAAFKKDLVDQLPIKPKRKKQIKLHRLVWIFHSEKTLAISKQNSGIMQDLYEFPYEELSSSRAFLDLTSKLQDVQITPLQEILALPKVTHSFTHHLVTLYPFLIEVDKSKVQFQCHWEPLKTLYQKPFSSGHRKILQHLKLHFFRP